MVVAPPQRWRTLTLACRLHPLNHDLDQSWLKISLILFGLHQFKVIVIGSFNVMSAVSKCINELRLPLLMVKWGMCLYTFVLSVVMVNLVVYPLGGVYDPSDFLQTVLKNIPLISWYAFFGAISLFVFVCWLVNTDEHLAVTQQARTVSYPPFIAAVPKAVIRTLHACRAPPVSA